MSPQDSSFARLVSLACHDLRTPLATVHGFARTIERTQELEDPLARYLEMINAAAAQMTSAAQRAASAKRRTLLLFETACVDMSSTPFSDCGMRND